MKWDEWAFVNEQLAALLKNGLPLEGALRQLCANMARGDLRNEFEELQADLARGVPPAKAFAARKFPAFYIQMINVGVASGDLPGVLTLVADYYRSSNLIMNRLKGLMIYPIIVAAILFVASFGFAYFVQFIQVWTHSWREVLEDIPRSVGMDFSLRLTTVFLWLPVIVFAVLLSTFILIATHPGLRRWLRWRVPVCRDVSLWQFASAMEVMLKSGCRLDEALEIMAQVEAHSPVFAEITQWQKRLAGGHGKFAEIAQPTTLFPPLFIWLVTNAGDELATGFKRAADTYHGRAAYRMESLLYVALPVAVLALGGLVFCQIYSLFHYIFLMVTGSIGRLGTNFGPDPSHNISNTVAALQWGLATLIAVIPFALFIWLIHWMLGLPLRRKERARLFLDLIESGFAQGLNPEATIVSLANNRDLTLGYRFHLLAAHLENGLHLSEALKRVRRFVSPQVAAILAVGEQVGDIRRVLPACRQAVSGTDSKLTSAVNYLVIMLFLFNPFGITILPFLTVVIVPKFHEIFLELLDGNPMPQLMSWFIEHRCLMTIVQCGLSGLVLVGFVLYLAGPWLPKFLRSITDAISYRLPWRRKRLQRDFSAMLAILLDAEAPDAEAARLAAQSTANQVFIQRGARVVERLKAGESLTDAIQLIDETGEFRWRLANATHGQGGFLAALSGWHAALDAKAYQLEQAASQIMTTSVVIVNGCIIGLITIGVFQVLATITTELSLW